MSAQDVVLVTGPPRAGVTSMAAGLRRRMPSYRFVEAEDAAGTSAPAAVVFVASAVAPVVESDCALVDLTTGVVIGVVSKIDDHRDWRRVPRLGEPSLDELAALLEAELAAPSRKALRTKEFRLTQLREEREELSLRRRTAAADRARTLRSDVQHARLGSAQTARRRCAALRAELIGEVAAVRMRDVAGFAERVRHRCGDVLSEIDTDIAGYTGRPPTPSPVPFPDPPMKARRLENRLMAVLGAGFGFGVAVVVTRFVAGLAPGLAAAGLATGVGIGTATAVWVIRARGLLHVRAVLQSWVADTSAAVRAAAEEKVATSVLDAEAIWASEGAAAAADEDAEYVRRTASIDAEIRKLARFRDDPRLLPLGRPPGDSVLNRSCE
ncbi:hypothetical protein PDG61_16130 [Mycolicibacterium sp. BiH015]|uniref:hypothetical protein n=1 Tax=Mycolicibacterium sp. BiH015 TaxID=3018808 RepID=UPI0022E751B1|nr:hypothetical protein [Mycolicibacterium sp. BiH015]MDA2892449.1 hypothetical protein [Mycolicibacterium sp. BiH015]